LDTDDLPKKKLPGIYRAPTPELLAYLDFSVSTTGMLAGIKMSHSSTTALCRYVLGFNPGMRRLSTVDLLVLTCSDELILILNFFFTIQDILTRRLIILRLLL
jgi:hypothetical protein